jgi:hypothetical protein
LYETDIMNIFSDIFKLVRTIIVLAASLIVIIIITANYLKSLAVNQLTVKKQKKIMVPKMKTKVADRVNTTQHQLEVKISFLFIWF